MRANGVNFKTPDNYSHMAKSLESSLFPLCKPSEALPGLLSPPHAKKLLKSLRLRPSRQKRTVKTPSPINLKPPSINKNSASKS